MGDRILHLRQTSSADQEGGYNRQENFLGFICLKNRCLKRKIWRMNNRHKLCKPALFSVSILIKIGQKKEILIGPMS